MSFGAKWEIVEHSGTSKMYRISFFDVIFSYDIGCYYIGEREGTYDYRRPKYSFISSH